MRMLRRQIRGLRNAQGVVGQDPRDMAAQARQLGELEEELSDRMRKFRKYGR